MYIVCHIQCIQCTIGSRVVRALDSRPDESGSNPDGTANFFLFLRNL